MNKKANRKSENNQNKTEEPKAVYQTVKIFNSFEEQEKEELKWLASLTPEQHLQHATSLIKRIFAEDLEKYPQIGNQLHFK